MRTFLIPAALGLLALVPTVPRAAEGEAATLPTSPVYGKPFLQVGSAAVGGYIDLEFKADEGGSTFDQHRFVPFIYASVSDRVHVASEIEFEHGGFVSGEEETDGEIKIEFATVDVTASEALNFRAGVVLVPLGRLNVNHDAPMLDLTERPLVTRNVIPSTFSESGLGGFGTFYPSEATTLSWEAYVVNGFNSDVVTSDGIIDVREGRGSKSSDNNNSRSVTGRLAFSPRLGTEIGVSGYTGKYTDQDAGNESISIYAVDAMAGFGALEFAGEGALGRAGYVDLGGMDATAKNLGFYVEGRYHFLAGALNLPESVFTGVVRLDYVDRDTNTDGRDQQRLTFGINFRITEETVIKNDLLFDRTRDGGVTEWGDTRTGYRFSVASYF